MRQDTSSGILGGAAAEALGRDLIRRSAEKKPGETVYTIANTTRLLRRLSWLSLFTVLVTALTSVGFDALQSRAEHAIGIKRQALRLSYEATALASEREAAIRGFLLSHVQLSLASELRGRERLPVTLHALEIASADDPAVLARVHSVREALKRWEDGFASFAVRHDSSPRGDSLSGKRLFEDVRARFDELNRFLGGQHDELTVYIYRLQFISIGVVLLELVAFAATVFFVIRKRLMFHAHETIRLAALLEAALASSPIGFVFLDTELRFIRVNSFLAEALGMKPEAFEGRRVKDVLSENIDQIQPALEMALATRTPVRNVLIVRRRGAGTDEAHFSASFYPIKTEDGVLLGAGAVIADVTDAVMKTRGLAESEERYRLVSRATSDAVFDWDLESGSLVWNDGITELFGYDKSDIVQHISWWSEHAHPADSERVMNNFLEAMNAGGDIWKSDEYSFRKKDGSYSIVVAGAHIMRRPDGTPYRVIGAISDRTREHSLAGQLRQSQKMEAIGRLAGGIAHDFNNILTVIRISTEFALAELPESHESRSNVEEIRNAADRAGKLTRQLLAFSRNQVLTPQLLNLSEVVIGVSGMLTRVIPENITLVTNLGPDVAPVKADPGQIEQVLLNLSINAADAMESGGTLTVATSNHQVDGADDEGPPGRYVCLTVSDTGTGMDSETVSKIFDPFFTTKAIGKGTGLGLATVHGIIAQSKGFIRVHSTLGVGSTFEILLPAVEEEVVAAEADPDFAPVPPVTGTILLVEDEEPTRTAVRKALERAGFAVIEAENGAVGLRVAQEHRGRIDLVLTDTMMPQMGGAELAARIAETRPETAILLMSGYAEGIFGQGLSRHRFRVIEKPFTIAALLAAIQGELSS